MRFDVNFWISIYSDRGETEIKLLFYIVHESSWFSSQFGQHTHTHAVANYTV